MKKIVLLTTTRADYGKIKPILRTLHQDKNMDVNVFVTGMHMLEKFGNTYLEVLEDNLGRIICDEDYHYESRMDISLANVIGAFSKFVRTIQPDMVIVHGDRLDAMAGAIVGAFNGFWVTHIEGGEISGTIDESIRHSISKLAHFHFVANEEAQKRLIQLGEPAQNVYIIGSPDVDIMLNDDLPSLKWTQDHYDIPFQIYGILLYHPVFTDLQYLSGYIKNILNVLKKSEKNYVVIYPNNDPGNEIIRRAYEELSCIGQFRIIPSMRFEAFLTLLRHADFMIGNSSAGIREACVYGVPVIDIGSRQTGRYNLAILKNVLHVNHNEFEIEAALQALPRHTQRSLYFGAGNSAEAFYHILQSNSFWTASKQKRFVDIAMDSI
jgi:UDP-N-acetylglucosamine 2-epimerase (hydrolysing)